MQLFEVFEQNLAFVFFQASARIASNKSLSFVIMIRQEIMSESLQNLCLLLVAFKAENVSIELKINVDMNFLCKFLYFRLSMATKNYISIKNFARKRKLVMSFSSSKSFINC